MPGGAAAAAAAAAATGKKLDLSKLTDEEAKHVWDVVQRDFDLRKKEEDRLGDLKTRIEREDTKRELLSSGSRLTESHCLRCLQPFKFLVNSRRRCLDCRLHVCKSCSMYNKKELGWVCDPCRMARVLKVGTLEWYHENVRARFKRFGSAKVMRSLFRRLSGERSRSQNDHEAHGYQENSVDAADARHYKEMKKSKRRLTVDPFDFELGCDYAVESRGRADQAEVSQDILDMDAGERESMLAEADVASVFHQILEEQQQHKDEQTMASGSVSCLSYSSCGSGSAWCPQGPEDSEEDDQLYPLYQSHLGSCSHASQESLNSPNPTPQVMDLNRRMSAIETFLNQMEEKVSSTYDETSQTPHTPCSSSPMEEVDLEEQQLRQKLHQMTDNISDHSLTSDEEEDEEQEEQQEEPSRPCSSQEVPAWRRNPEGEARPPSRIPTRPTSRSSIVLSRLEEEQPENSHSQTASLDRKWQNGPRASFRGSTALLVELEDQVAQAAANVQNAKTEVSDIQNRIAALNAAGLPLDKRRKSAIPIQTRRLSYSFLPTTSQFERNSFYRSSLTQRNPTTKPKATPTCAKPVMTQGS